MGLFSRPQLLLLVCLVLVVFSGVPSVDAKKNKNSRRARAEAEKEANLDDGTVLMRSDHAVNPSMVCDRTAMTR